ncbi:hypothetical protein [Parendozoicomonas haliclonae]|uniref:Uncharacterized protein n=1 Tax=Parendozoicomonas haliclonae TaxID=1960125 RepID=A0A1X7AF39_9GAMM|nr:hypothetical protein [Parendozoicomonas haliclonae]SMA34595.1 hypothetical protein EHSB41UT_00422 [Parendozoicomonas haliclonae]
MDMLTTQQPATQQAAAKQAEAPVLGPKADAGRFQRWKARHFANGFIQIPRAQWAKGLGKGKGAKFFISSFSRLLIIPANYQYPHLSASMGQTFIDQDAAHVRIDSLHYSAARDAERVVFYRRDERTYETGAPFDDAQLKTAQSWIDKSGLPFILAVKPCPSIPQSFLTSDDLEPDSQDSGIDTDRSSLDSSSQGSGSDTLEQELDTSVQDLATETITTSKSTPTASKGRGRARSKKKAPPATKKKKKPARSSVSLPPTSKAEPQTTHEASPVAMQKPLLCTRDHTSDWEAFLGTDSLEQYLNEDLKTQSGIQPDSRLLESLIEAAADDFTAFHIRIQDERVNESYLISTARIIGDRFQKLICAKKQNRDRIRNLLESSFNDLKKSSSPFVDYSARAASRQQIQLSHINPGDLPKLQAAVTALPSPRTSQQELALNLTLRFFASSLTLNRVDAFTSEMEGFSNAMASALRTSSRPHALLIAGMVNRITALPIIYGNQLAEDIQQMSESADSLTELTRLQETMDGRLRELQELTTEFFTFSFYMTDLLIQMDVADRGKITQVLDGIPESLRTSCERLATNITGQMSGQRLSTTLDTPADLREDQKDLDLSDETIGKATIEAKLCMHFFQEIYDRLATGK